MLETASPFFFQASPLFFNLITLISNLFDGELLLRWQGPHHASSHLHRKSLLGNDDDRSRWCFTDASAPLRSSPDGAMPTTTIPAPKSHGDVSLALSNLWFLCKFLYSGVFLVI
ncbi:putative NADPH--cytochrome P450 reductase [Iris pallida]|uniref:NADPH--cytochrome P450 reductase n=1 Tax=Iris pallida TaxID=29817 RepID=A0AAX6H3P5_IRIPA|nr:putative NADPH--cytochrome P450 reductase [Iris pallida]